MPGISYILKRNVLINNRSLGVKTVTLSLSTFFLTGEKRHYKLLTLKILIMSILTIILNILLPPLAVLLKHGVGTTFLISLLLTILGWIPGVIHAFIVNG